jgi:hypothetical protein
MYFYCAMMYVSDLAIKTPQFCRRRSLLFFHYCAIWLLLKWEKLVNCESLNVGKLALILLSMNLNERLRKWSVHQRIFMNLKKESHPKLSLI